MDLNIISGRIIECAIKVHKTIGPGLLESTYETCLMYELRKAGLNVESQVYLPVIYDGLEIDAGYRIDILAENAVIVELKSVENILPIHQAGIRSRNQSPGDRPRSFRAFANCGADI